MPTRITERAFPPIQSSVFRHCLFPKYTRRGVDIAVANKITPTLVAALIITTLVIASDTPVVCLALVSVRAVVIFAGVHCGYGRVPEVKNRQDLKQP